MGKEISHFIIHFLILNVLTMIEDIVERFNRNFFSYILKSATIIQYTIKGRFMSR